MNKVGDFLKKYSWVWIIIVVFAAYFGDLYLQRILTGTNKPTPSPVAQIASYKSVIPGVSSEEDLKSLLGTPLKTTINGNQTTDEYKSTSPSRNHIIIIENGVVVLIREIVSATDTIRSPDITSIYGVPPNTLYSKLPNSSFNLYVYPANGIAYIGHKDGTLSEIWYFQPIPIKNFIEKWGQNYATSPPTEILQ